MKAGTTDREGGTERKRASKIEMMSQQMRIKWKWAVLIV